MNINSEFTKYVIVALTFQWWFPFLKAIWDDFNDALRDEGGVLGLAPPRRKLEELDRELGEYQSSLRSERRPAPGGKFGGRGENPAPTPTGGPAASPAASSAPRKRGFR